MPVAKPASRRRSRLAWCEVLAVALLCIIGSVVSTAAAQSSKTSGVTEPARKRMERTVRELRERHDREVRAGQGAEAAQTAQELEKLNSELKEIAREEKCEPYWRSLYDLVGSEAVLTSQQTKNLQATAKLSGECGSTAPPVFNESDLTRMLIEGEAFRSRELLFVEPVLLKSTGKDLPNPMMGFVQLSIRAPQLLKSLQATMSSGLSDLTETKKAYERLMATVERSAGSNPAPVIAILEMLRQLVQIQGDTSAAIGYVQSELDLLESRFGRNSVQLCPSLWQAASLWASNGEPSRAIEASSRCLTMAAKGGDSSITYASALNNLGVMHHRNGAPDRALDSYRKSLAILERNPGGVADVFNAADRPLLRVHANLGLAYWQLGDLPQAVRHLQIAREQMSKEGQGFFTEKGVVASMAKLAAELDMFLTVERSAQTSMPDAPNIALPMLLERKGLALEAKSTAVHAFADSPDQLREYRSLLAYRSTLARGTRSTSIEREVPPKTADEVDRQIQTIEVEAQRRSTQAVAAAQSKAVSTHPQQKQYSEALAKASMKRYSEATKRARKTDPGDLAALMMEAQQKAMADVAPRFKDYLDAQQQGLQQTDRGGRESLLRSIQAKLPETAALLEMVRFRPFNPRALAEADRWEPARYGAYLVKQTGTPVFLDYGEAGPVDELVVEFRRTLASPRGTLAHDLGRRLDAMLMQPTRAQLGTTTHLYVSPDGALNLVPFGALVDEQDRYLIETFTFNYLSSGRDLTREARRGTAQLGPAVVIADPAFDGEVKPGATPASTDSAASTSSRGSLNHFDSLPGTAVEAQAIKRILSDATVYTGGRATETMLKSVKVPRVLHVATHGFFLDDQDLSAASSSPGASQPAEDPMLRSGLVFAGANSRQSGTDDGVLTALEAAGLDLAGTQLVVLSACETGVGAVRAGEGVFGLRRAFTVAGAETLVMSLWQVDDDATQRLMVEFYGRLAKGEGRGEALRQASLTLLRDPAHRHPFYWSSFISTGESGPMRR